MAWTTPKTDWTTGNLVAASDLNAMGDNLVFVKDRLDATTHQYLLDEVSNYTTTSTSFVDVDSTNLSFSITTNGGDVICSFYGEVAVSSSSNRTINFNIAVDGTPQVSENGLVGIIGKDSNRLWFSFVYIITGLTAGTYDISLQWKINASTAILHATDDHHPAFIVKEI